MCSVTSPTFSSLPQPRSCQQLSLSAILSTHTHTYKFTEFICYGGSLEWQKNTHTHTHTHATSIPCLTALNNHKQPQFCRAVILSALPYSFPSAEQLLFLSLLLYIPSFFFVSPNPAKIPKMFNCGNQILW